LGGKNKTNKQNKKHNFIFIRIFFEKNFGGWGARAPLGPHIDPPLVGGKYGGGRQSVPTINIH